MTTWNKLHCVIAFQRKITNLPVALAASGLNRSISCQTLHWDRPDTSISMLPAPIPLLLSLPLCFLQALMISHPACSLRPLTQRFPVCVALNICRGLPYPEALPPQSKEFHPFCGSLSRCNGKRNAAQSSFFCHHITLQHFSLQVCDLY